MLKENEKIEVSELNVSTEAVTLTKQTIAVLAVVVFISTFLAGLCLLYIQSNTVHPDIYYMPASNTEYEQIEDYDNLLNKEYEDRQTLPESIVLSNDYDDIKDIDTQKAENID